jgi:hypothetical protein
MFAIPNDLEHSKAAFEDCLSRKNVADDILCMTKRSLAASFRCSTRQSSTFMLIVLLDVLLEPSAWQPTQNTL